MSALYIPPILTDEMTNEEKLLAFALSCANCRSANFWGFEHDIAQAARTVVVKCGHGDKMEARSRFEAGSDVFVPWPKPGQPDTLTREIIKRINKIESQRTS